MTQMQKLVFWTPRALSILFVLFLALFALDVFSENSGAAVIVPLLIHLIPSLVLLAAAAIAWKYDWFGALTYFGFAVWYVWSAGFDRPWSWYAAIVFPAVVVGTLYLASWMQLRRRRARPDATIGTI
jgi:hypothetical protein